MLINVINVSNSPLSPMTPPVIPPAYVPFLQSLFPRYCAQFKTYNLLSVTVLLYYIPYYDKLNKDDFHLQTYMVGTFNNTFSIGNHNLLISQ